MTLTIANAIEQAQETRTLFAQLETKLYGAELSTKDLALGFTVDLGDLIRLIQSANGRRPPIKEVTRKLEHEFADCLWSILVLSDRLDVDIEQSFQTLITDLKVSIQAQLEE